MRKRTPRVPSLFLAVLMLCLTALPAPASAESATAAAMQLVKTEGTVSVTNASRRSLTVRNNMQLYNGYHAETKAKSYAWINLDDVKLTKLDASTKAEVRKRGKKLELLVSEGNLFFNVTSPLAADETMNIRTSTMLIGIRGTAGWIKAADEDTTEVYVLEGKVECAAADLASGRTRTTTISAGERAVVSVRHGQEWEISREKFSAGDIDGFVMDELKQDPELCAKILEASGLDILGTGGGSATASGQIGDITWNLSGGTLTLEGKNNIGWDTWMGNYSPSDLPPWGGYREQIRAVTIGDGVANIVNYGFFGCSNLTTVDIPASVNVIISSSAFNNCNSLTSINVASGNRTYTSVDGILFSADQTVLYRYPEGKSGLSYRVPDSVTRIGQGAFSGSRNLTSVIIPAGVTSIETQAFVACPNLASVTIPASVTSIGMYAFEYCSNLSDIYYGGSKSQWEQITIGEANEPLTSATIHYNS